MSIRPSRRREIVAQRRFDAGLARRPSSSSFAATRYSRSTLSRGALHRCLQRHGVSRRPNSKEGETKCGRFVKTTIGYFHIDICEPHCAEGKPHMFLAVDRVSEFTYVELHPVTILTSAASLRNAIAAFPYKLPQS